IAPDCHWRWNKGKCLMTEWNLSLAENNTNNFKEGTSQGQTCTSHRAVTSSTFWNPELVSAGLLRILSSLLDCR
ncbi:hypothetical protein lerEdw1_004996, partial [Lerista edwardsae]